MKWIKLLCLTIFLSSCAAGNVQQSPKVTAETTQNVYFAGLSFTGNFKDNKLNYPYSYEIAKKLPVDRLFVEKLKNVDNPSLNLLTSLGNTDEADALAMSLSIDLETVNIAKTAEKYKVVIDLYAQILVFDFNEKKIINSYPINLQYITFFNHNPSKKEIQAIFEGFYTGENPEVKTNLFDLAVENLNNAQIKPKYGNRLAVSKVVVSDKAKKMLTEMKQSEDNFKTITAQSFSRYIVDNQNAAMLPYTKGQVIGSKMSARFVNGDVYNLEIPAPDYVFNIEIRDFKNLSDNAGSSTTELYGFFVYTKIEMMQPDLNKKYMDSKFRGFDEVVLMKGQKPNFLLSYQETLMNLFNNFSKNISDTDDEWYEKTLHPSQYDIVEEQFEQVNDVINSCK